MFHTVFLTCKSLTIGPHTVDVLEATLQLINQHIIVQVSCLFILEACFLQLNIL